MSATTNTSAGKTPKNKRSILNRPASSSMLDGDFFLSSRIDMENDGVTPAYKSKLLALFKQIEKEFDLLYQENQTCECISYLLPVSFDSYPAGN